MHATFRPVRFKIHIALGSMEAGPINCKHLNDRVIVRKVDKRETLINTSMRQTSTLTLNTVSVRCRRANVLQELYV